ncbi:ThiF family adenylyltransferase [Henriciella sp.]|uniref:ThiF family adenylyltransferase n=1 Tax=Henriciella sp. TaxID=1968823 RepID=UPI00262D17F1|nr:ThiF family adenylyltransferase [Henriciella sp.]
MSQQLISRSPDLQALFDDGYELSVVAGHLVVSNVPYVAHDKSIKRGTLVSTLALSGNQTAPPSTHVMKFSGDHPCDKNGHPLKGIVNGQGRTNVGDGLVTNLSFSCKPTETGKYANYYDKVTTYVGMISGPAEVIDPAVTAQTFAVTEAADDDTPFKYIDSASSRAGISAISDTLKFSKVAIVGLGGTGSYILDLVAKTPVGEIHLIDGDEFMQHNAFRAPGAASIEQLRRRQKKVDYLAEAYGALRNGIVPHATYLTKENISLLEGMDFVFVAVDKGQVKGAIADKLDADGVAFIDVGMGISIVDEALFGVVRTTTSSPQQRSHFEKCVNLSGNDADDAYRQNIQIADLNALNAALAVMRWKKLVGFYVDLEHEHQSNFTIDGNIITNSHFHEA